MPEEKVVTKVVSVYKSGKDLVVRLPKVAVEMLGIQPRDHLVMKITPRRIIIEKLG